MTAQQGIHPPEVLRRRLRGTRKLLALRQQPVKLLWLQRYAVEKFPVTEAEPDRHDVNTQPLYLTFRQIGPRIRDDGDMPGLVHQPMLTAHVIGLLLGNLTEFLTGQEQLSRIIDMYMNANAVLSARDHQRTAVQRLQAPHDGLTVQHLTLDHAFGAEAVLSNTAILIQFDRGRLRHIRL